MNANTMSKTLADAVETDLASNVIPMKRPNAEKLADLHRRGAHQCAQRIADTKRFLKSDIATVAAARKAEKARHDAAMLAFAEDEASVKQIAAEAIAEDERLAKYNRGALDALAD